jgi:hypothetical protein
MKITHAWALVSPRGYVILGSVEKLKRDVRMTIYEELLGCKVEKVVVSVAPSWQNRKRTNPP